MRIFDYALLALGSNNVLVSCRQKEHRCPRPPPPFLYDSDDSTQQGDIPSDWPWELRARYKIPPLLHTSYESPVVAQKFYQIIFRYQFNHERGVWFNFDRDKLTMQSGGAFDFFKHGVEDNEGDYSEAKKVEKALRYLGIRAMVCAEVVALLDYSQDLQNLNALYLEKGFLLLVWMLPVTKNIFS
jgi:hypothetical protein